MKEPPKRLDRPSFWKWASPLVLGLWVLTLIPVGGRDTLVIVVTAKALARLVLLVLLAVALTRRFRDVGWRAWTGPTFLLVTMLGPPFLVAGYAAATYDNDIFEWFSTVRLISNCVNLVLLIVTGCVPGKPAPITEVARVFD